ncbi:hypothetical protein OQJ13_07400 [Legionella sp. PATHC035]|uniref:hypothetical protein n=1 Tax=Legionella sp. PATHC035 TaxID=2992040 RepID=UPI002243D2BB|nr:hypothetical protein [Legionella sp. PATHC035]MCW8408794.1 hypothetical protein [Legionella sp. PATHC035]
MSPLTLGATIIPAITQVTTQVTTIQVVVTTIPAGVIVETGVIGEDAAGMVVAVGTVVVGMAAGMVGTVATVTGDRNTFS